MTRSRGRFLAALVVMVASGAGLISTIPGALGADAAIPAWIPIALGALFAASAVVAARVRPADGRRRG
ncbi:hypothetical protein [Clavibacter michiganensis]|uniref:Uncharacterized protein n=1 Tax=Clavibacter michiganensis TaxID=28447 RepID=A0A251YJR6_9MICO|nr:hypothetical protein [Clavibacter michiganensis]OUE24409.1 hypothetical protein BFL37_10885 [Clavibacter michiganensis]